MSSNGKSAHWPVNNVTGRDMRGSPKYEMCQPPGSAGGYGKRVVNKPPAESGADGAILALCNYEYLQPPSLRWHVPCRPTPRRRLSWNWQPIAECKLPRPKSGCNYWPASA